LRYSAELAVGVLGGPARRIARRSARLQERLGDVQDSVITEHWLRAQLDEASPELAFVCGQLCAGELSARHVALARWPSAWREVQRKGAWRKL
jgi:CHAD domain-containing protein